MTRLVTVLCLVSTLMSLPAEAESPAFPADVLKGIDAMQRLPVEGFHVVESQGRLLLVSTNGHYAVLEGRIVDLWNGIEIRSVADVDRTRRIPLRKMGVKASELGGVAVGRGPDARAVTVFLDPASSETTRMLPTIRPLLARYRVQFVFVPAQPSRAAASRALICAPKAAKVFVTTGERDADPSADERCGIEALQRNMVIVSLLGIEVLPTIIAPNGVTATGVPQDLGQFIAANLE